MMVVPGYGDEDEADAKGKQIGTLVENGRPLGGFWCFEF